MSEERREIVRLTNTATGALELKLAYEDASVDRWFIKELVALAGGMGPCSLNKSPKKNWVEQEGGLPTYICNIAKDIAEERGKSIGNAIQIAVGVVQRWARGQGDVTPATRAKAAAAIAQWERMKASAKARPNKK